ncbi:MAG TPA: efflux transporter outer membrane subunit [Steroidobacteraceae bacterium]|nr:efflux transporter outer membrane subunit [Steroidobacteraceae bacterium]
MANRPLTVATVLGATLIASGCAWLEPKVPEGKPGIPVEWPLPPDSPRLESAAASSVAAADIGWREFFVDPALQQLISLALANNRDLRVAVLNVEKARQLYRIQRADRVPNVGGNVAGYRSGGDPLVGNYYSASVGISNFELDLFGRVRDLSEAQLQRYLAQEEARRAAQLSLIAEVAYYYLGLAADREQLRLAQATLKIREDYHALTVKRHELGAVSALDLEQERTQVEGARADAARYAGQVAVDADALALLVGAQVETKLLPTTFDGEVVGIAALPAGVPSTVLLRRPDVLAAEHLLRAANANVGAARAAFFPQISLTGAIGTASSELSGLFASGTSVWLFEPQVNIPIFEGGRLVAGLGAANADRDIALAQYEKSIQQGFREVSDALALTATLAAQRSALQALVDSAQHAEDLSRARYEAGRDSYLVRLEAQRTLYVSQQALIATRLSEQWNRVTLYKVLGGGWKERTP